MKKLIIGLILGVAIGGGLAWWTLRPTTGEHAAASAGDEAKPDEATAANPLQISAAKRASAGITVANPKAMELAPEVQAFGRVLDPTPYVSLVAEEATARASLAASEKELERVQKLFASGGNASAQAVETAQAAASRDRAAVESAQVRLLAGWGPTLAQHADLSSIRDVLTKGAALIRIDLLPGVKPADSFNSAEVSPLGSTETYRVTVVGAAPVADPQVQGASYLALLHGHSLPAGASLQVRLPGPGAAASVLVVPHAAIVYHEGSAWVFVLGAHDTFERKLVTLGRAVDDGAVIEKGIEAGDQVAVTGAQQLLSAQLETGGTPDER